MTTPEIDMTVIRQACALVQGVRSGYPEVQIAPVAAWARSAPDTVAALVVVLACIANEDSANPAYLFELLSDSGVDMTEMLKDAHRVYEQYRGRREAGNAPAWARAGERLYSRLARRRRMNKKEAA